MRIAIVMTYLDRQYQLDQTLESLKQSKYKDFEVIIMDDNSQKEIKLAEEYPFKITIVRTGKKQWMNGVPAYNRGFNLALSHNPDLIMIQNAECYHVGDVLTFAEQNTTTKNFLAFGCFSLDESTTFSEHNIFDVVNAHNYRARQDGVLGWYTHPKLRPEGYHFCASITAENLRKLNGFDERFSYGYAFEDVYFLHQIRVLGIKIEITTPPQPFVVHQYHYGTIPADYVRYVCINRVVYDKLITGREYRAKHEITKDL